MYNDEEQDYGYYGLDSTEMAEDFREDYTIPEVKNDIEEFDYDAEDNYLI